MTETLTAFLLARYDEEYALAEGEPGFDEPREGIAWGEVGAISEVLMISPARVLADVEAKRRIVNWAAPISSDYERIPTDRPGVYDTRPLRYVSDDGHDLLCILALPYADHPDYREEWRP